MNKAKKIALSKKNVNNDLSDSNKNINSKNNESSQKTLSNYTYVFSSNTVGRNLIYDTLNPYSITKDKSIFPQKDIVSNDISIFNFDDNIDIFEGKDDEKINDFNIDNININHK